MIFANRKRNRRKPERTAGGRSFSLAWLKPIVAGGLQSVLGITGMLIGIGIMLWGLALAFDRPIGQVEVGGRFQRVAPVQIEDVVAPFRGAGFLSGDLDALRAALETIITHAVGLHEALFQAASQHIDVKDPSQRAALEKKLDALGAQIHDATTRTHFKNYFR